MTAPIISCICLEYGRPAQVSEALECFLRQVGGVPSEFILLNSCAQIQYEFNHPCVKVINLAERPSSLGATRNLAISHASGQWIVTWDSDDEFAPWHLKSFADRIADGIDFVWLDKNYYCEGGRIKKICQGMANTVAFTKAAWEQVGRYAELSVGEDRDFVGRLTKAYTGVRAELKPEEIGYLYNWANSVWHISGEGDDKPGRTNAWERSRLDLEQRIRRGSVKTGRIVLTPAIKVKTEDKIHEFLKAQSAHTPKATACLVELGRLGDIINLLPVARLIAELHAPPAMMVSREFAPVLEGVSYVVPHAVDLPYTEVKRAVELARKSYPAVICCQIWGKHHHQEKKTPAYNLESWRMAGMERLFHDFNLLPVFDRRDLERERAIFRKLSDGRPMLLLKLHGGLSSPFPGGGKLEAALRERFSATHQVVELTSLKVERLYDLIGLMDRAATLVTIDTATVHLAAASGVPVVALVNPLPWLGTLPRCNCVARLTYAAASEPAHVIRYVESALAEQPVALSEPAPICPPQRKILHCCERHEEPRNPRKEAAWASWDVLYQRGVIPCHYWKYARDARSIGDKRALPYLKDVLAFAMEQAADTDIIFFTNDDNWLHPDLIAVLQFHVAVYGACSSQRCEFHGQILKPDRPPSEFARRGRPHMGRDLFAFTKAWLAAKWEEIPDFILGASDWDLALACLIRLEKGVLATRQNIEESIWPCELERGLVSHAYHKPTWLHPGNVDAAASQNWNRRLFRAWGEKYLPSLKFQKGNVI